jgi:phage tail protein X
MAAAAAAGLTTDAEQAALAGAKPVEPPDFGAMLAQYKADQQAQIDKLQADFEKQLAALRAGVPAPLVDPRVNVARNLTDGLALLAKSYPAAARLEPMAKANGVLAEAVAVLPDGADTPVPDPAAVAQVLKTFRRFAAANPQLETGLIEHAAQITEDVFDL